ncbi:MAG: YbjN domain-containing protein [Leucobacter sp.]|nr:YbjN domain-containing protein [Leucobacter sp.]
MSAIEITREKVQAYLTDIYGSIQVDGDGDFSVQRGSARMFARVQDFGENETLVTVFTPLVRGAKTSADLFEYVALSNTRFIFGRLELSVSEDGTADIFLAHNLLGDYLDKDELGYVFVGMLGSADELDNEIAEQFGGAVFHAE